MSIVNLDSSSIKLEVGSTVGSSGTAGVDYTVNGTLPTLETGNSWAVLGEENGKLLLVTTKNITKNGTVQNATFNGNDASLYKTIIIKDVDGKTDVESVVVDEDNVSDTINKIIENCGITIDNTVADSIRSINVDDINRVTTYNPENIGLQHSGGPYGGSSNSNKNAFEYGNTVRYETGKAIVAKNKASGTTSSTCRKPVDSSETNSIFTVKSDYYNYYPGTLTTSSERIQEIWNTGWYKLLFTNEGLSKAYWLSSTCVKAEHSRRLLGYQVCADERECM